MSKFFVAIVVMCLVLASMPVVMAQTETAEATVTVNAYISTSIIECPDANVSETFTYGSQDPGTADVPIECQDISPDEGTTAGVDGALTITIDAITNVDVTVTLSGTNYTKGVVQEIAIEDTKYNKDNSTLTGATAFPAEGATAATLWSITADPNDVDKDIWFWLSVPSTYLPAGTYTSTYTFSIS